MDAAGPARQHGAMSRKSTQAKALVPPPSRAKAGKRPKPADTSVPFTATVFGQCRFIVDDSQSPVICCGAPTVGGRSWCARHQQIVYVKPPDHQRRR
jgi:hypothetical protein